MTYKLFIDDERYTHEVVWAPADVRASYETDTWLIARNMTEVMDIVKSLGMPSFVSFDHDLGDGERTGYDIAKAMVDMDMDGTEVFPADFSFYVHSQNPVGKKNIENYLDNYFNYRD